jgi:hypothetical protein
MLVRIDLDLACFTPAEARRQHKPEFPALCLGVTGSDAALSHQAQFVFRHRSLRDGDILPRNICLMFRSNTRITRVQGSALPSYAGYSMAAALISSLSNAMAPRCCRLG